MLVQKLRNEKSAQRGSLGDGYPADIRGSFARISRRKTSVRALKMLEKNKHLGADIHDPKARTATTLRDFQKLRSEKLWAEFSFPKNIHEAEALLPMPRILRNVVRAMSSAAVLPTWPGRQARQRPSAALHAQSQPCLSWTPVTLACPCPRDHLCTAAVLLSGLY